jgi:hypothetical protein
MAHEMIEEAKLLTMIHSVFHDSLLATSTCNSATSSDNSTAIRRTTTDTVDTTSTATTTGDQKQPKRSSESQSQGDIKRQRTYESANEITKFPDLTDLNHQQQTSPDTENTETQQGEHTHDIPKAPNETIGERQITHTQDKDRTHTRTKEFTSEYAEPNTTATPQGDNLDVGSRGTVSLTAIEEEKNVHVARSSGPSCEPLTVSKTGLHRRTR